MYSSFFAIERLPLDYTGEKKWNEHLTVKLSGSKMFSTSSTSREAVITPPRLHTSKRYYDSFSTTETMLSALIALSHSPSGIADGILFRYYALIWNSL
jgi:hypothetical protein